MKKTYYFFTVFVLIIILAFIITKKDKSLEENIIKYNPKNPTLIFEGHNLNKFLKEIKNNSNVFKEITKNKKINNITNHLFLIDSIIQSENTFSISLYNNAKKANIFMVFNIEETHKIKNSIKNKYKNIEFENFEDYYINNLNNEIFFTIINKNLVISSSKILIETSINQYKKNVSLLDEIELQKIYKQTNQTNENILILNHYEISDFKKEVLNVSKKTTNEIAKWSVLDFKTTKNNINFYGLSSTNTQNKNYVNIIKNQSAQNILIDEFFPSETINYKAICFDDFESLLINYKKFLKNNDVMFSYNKVIQEEDEVFFNNNIGNQIAKIILNNSHNNKENIFYIAKNKNNTSDLNQKEKQKSYTINELKNKNIVQMILENSINKNNFKYYTNINSYIVFGVNKSAMQDFINVYTNNEKLINKKEYFKYKTSSIGKSNIFFYTNPMKIKEYLNNNIREDFFHQSSELDKLTGFNCSYNYENEIIYNAISIQYQPDYNETNTMTWQTKHDTTIWKMFSFQNPQQKSNYILIQDVNNYISLYKDDGTIFGKWPRKIGSKILGNISAIKYYQNTNRQILFNTKDSLYIIDVHGNYIENYPKKLNSNTKYGHTLINYKDNNWNMYRDQFYRILMEENNEINNYSKEGKIVTGWRFKEKIKNSLNSKIKYKPIKNKNKILDHIYIIDNKGNAKILKRDGRFRAKINKDIPMSNNDFYVDSIGNIFSSNRHGSIFKTDLKSNIKLLYENNFTKHHLFIKQEGKESFICVDENKIILHENQQQKTIYKINDLKASEIKISLTKNKKKYITIQDTINENIHIIQLNNNEIKNHITLKGNFFSDINYIEKIYNYKEKEVSNNIIIANKNYIINYNLK